MKTQKQQKTISYLSVDLDQALLHDVLDLRDGEGVLEPVPEEEGHWHGLPHLVGAGGGPGGEGTTQLVQHP